MIRYLSTRGEAPELGFADALLAGLATDGGLYCPAEVPTLPELDPDAPYAEIAAAVMWPFVEGSIERNAFDAIVADAYSVFRHDDVVPLVQIEPNHFLLDLAWGPTLAFKDVALQLVGRLLDHELEKRGETVTVLGATSGDTGSAAIDALKGRSNVKVAILHPAGRVSEVQRRQMTTIDAANVANIAIDGNFDDCQDLVKAAFNDPALRAEFGLAAVNSINWARVMAQVVYYVVASLRLTKGERPVSFSVPTGNFGNVLAGWYAKRMGVPIDQLIVASNRNDVLTRFFDTGALTAETVVASLSPSMDIQVSSNFERLLWEASGRDGAAVGELLSRFRADGQADVDPAWVEAIRSEFVGGRLDDEGTLGEIRRVQEESGVLIEPHTAVGVAVGRELRSDPETQLVTLATAHPAKFPDAVESAVGERPDLPEFLSHLLGAIEHLDHAPNDLDAIAAKLRLL